MKELLVTGLIGICFAILSSVVLANSSTSASTMTLYPSSDPAGLTGNATTSWLSYSTGVPQYQTLRLAGTNESFYLCGSAGTWGYLYDVDDVVNVGQGVTSIKVDMLAKMRRASIFTTPDDRITLNAYVGGNALGTALSSLPYYSDTTGGTTCTASFSNTGNEWRSLTYDAPIGSPWSLSQINSLQLYLGRQVVGSGDIIKLFRANATITFDADPKVNTYTSRIYQDSNTTAAGSPISPNFGEPGQLTSRGQKFRFRAISYNTTGDSWRAGYGGVKLQYAKKTTTDCTTQTGWTDVTSSSTGIRFYDNPNIADGTTISYVGDPDVGSVIGQQYRESNNGAVVTAIPSTVLLSGWDFSLQESPGAYGGSYCLKLRGVSPAVDDSAVVSAGEVRLHPEPLGVDMVDSAGASIANPIVNFGLINVSFTCQQSTATLGTTSQKIRFSNGLATNGWSASIAATNGTSALWTSTGGSMYDYNDPAGSPSGCSSGSDGDGRAGQLRVNPSASTITPVSGCSATGLTKGSNAAFSSGAVGSITLLTATSLADMYCAWDMTGTALTQTIPPGTQPGNYSLDLTLTTVAS